MKIILWIYIAGCICGFISNISYLLLFKRRITVGDLLKSIVYSLTSWVLFLAAMLGIMEKTGVMDFIIYRRKDK